MLVAAAPATAATSVDGAFQGTVNFAAPGIPTGTCGPTSYMLNHAAEEGVSVSTSAGAYAGLTNLSADGGSSCENTEDGAGIANVMCSGGVGLGTNLPGLQAGTQCAGR
jgi:hypothetical protein